MDTMQKKLDSKLNLNNVSKDIDVGYQSVISPPEAISPKVGSPRRREKRGPWEIIQVRQFSLDGKEQIQLTPRARVHKELTIRNPSRVVKPKQKYDSILHYENNPTNNSQKETDKKSKNDQHEYLSIVSQTNTKNFNAQGDGDKKQE